MITPAAFALLFLPRIAIRIVAATRTSTPAKINVNPNPENDNPPS
jgi:hypothetical protein